MFDVNPLAILLPYRSNVLRTVLSGFTRWLWDYLFSLSVLGGTRIAKCFYARGLQVILSKIQFRYMQGKTTIAYGGLQSNREVVLKTEDYECRQNRSQVNFISKLNTAMILM